LASVGALVVERPRLGRLLWSGFLHCPMPRATRTIDYLLWYPEAMPLCFHATGGVRKENSPEFKDTTKTISRALQSRLQPTSNDGKSLNSLGIASSRVSYLRKEHMHDPEKAVGEDDGEIDQKQQSRDAGPLGGRVRNIADVGPLTQDVHLLQPVEGVLKNIDTQPLDPAAQCWTETKTPHINELEWSSERMAGRSSATPSPFGRVLCKAGFNPMQQNLCGQEVHARPASPNYLGKLASLNPYVKDSDADLIPTCGSMWRSRTPSPDACYTQVPTNLNPCLLPASVPSLGSVGHPYGCAKACKFNKTLAGCKDRSTCKRCHLCRWSKSVG